MSVMCANRPVEWICGSRTLRIGASPLVMGILNVTPDSFSDGGRYVDKADAVEQALRMVADGADIVDIGGESTRPGAAAVGVDEELKRVLPVLKAVRHESDVCISIDTSKAAVALAALDAGADIVNDVTALGGDPDMPDVVRRKGAGAVLMHMRGTPRTMQVDPHYDDVVEEVGGFLASRAEALIKEGLERERLAIDPGIGFGKTVDHNLDIIRNLDRFHELGTPLLIGASRKAFIRHLLKRKAQKEPEPLSAEVARGTQAAVAAAAMNGADIVRVHDVARTRTTLTLIDAIRSA